MTHRLNSMVIIRGKEGGGMQKRVNGGQMVMEGDLTLSGEHTMQYTDDVLQNYTPEIYVILITNVIPINSIKKNLKKLFGIKVDSLTHPC